jgi:hypothetical protein
MPYRIPGALDHSGFPILQILHVQKDGPLKKPPLHLLVKMCRGRISRPEIIELPAGRSRPHRKTQELLESILKKLDFLQKKPLGPPNFTPS